MHLNPRPGVGTHKKFGGWGNSITGRFSRQFFPREVSLEPLFKRREDLGKHSVYTHFPKDGHCEICKRTKITRAPCRRRNGEAVPRAVNFGELIPADDKVLSDNCESRNHHRNAVVVQDLVAQWIQAYPCKNKTSPETQKSLHKFLEPGRKPKVIYTDNSLEFGQACEDLSWNYCTIHHDRRLMGLLKGQCVEWRKARRCIVAIKFKWKLVGRLYGMYIFLRNVKDLLIIGKKPHERRFGQPFEGPIVPLASLVKYYPATAKDQSRVHQFVKNALLGLFLGNVLGADLEELETMYASEVYSKKLNAKEVIFH